MWIESLGLDCSRSETLLGSRQTERSRPRGQTDLQRELDNRSDAGERGNDEIKASI